MIITNADATPHNAALWSQRVETSTVKKRWTGVDPTSAKSEKAQRAAFAKRLSNLALHWRVSNGVFISGHYEEATQGRSTSERAMDVAVTYTDNQWFFGVIGPINLQLFLMRPPIDRTLSDEQRQALPQQLPTYPLPEPRDVSPSLRAELVRRGRVLPTFQDWLALNPGVYAHYFPQNWQAYLRRQQPVPVGAGPSDIRQVFELARERISVGHGVSYRSGGLRMIITLSNDHGEEEAGY